MYDNPNIQQSPSQGTSGVLPGVTMGLGKCEGLCGKAGASINSFNCIFLSSSAQCSGCTVNELLFTHVYLIVSMTTMYKNEWRQVNKNPMDYEKEGI